MGFGTCIITRGFEVLSRDISELITFYFPVDCCIRGEEHFPLTGPDCLRYR